MNDPRTKPMEAPGANEWGSLKHVQSLVLIVATAFGVYLCYRLDRQPLPDQDDNIFRTNSPPLNELFSLH